MAQQKHFRLVNKGLDFNEIRVFYGICKGCERVKRRSPASCFMGEARPADSAGPLEFAHSHTFQKVRLGSLGVLARVVYRLEWPTMLDLERSSTEHFACVEGLGPPDHSTLR